MKACDLPNRMDVSGDHKHCHSDPILRAVEYREDGERFKMLVCGGLHYIRGNHAPYFSLTADIRRASKVSGKWVEDSGGCCHDEILKHCPEFASLAALHLSDWHGVPMHAEANGWHWFAGAAGGLGQKYGPLTDWRGKVEKTPEQCLQIFADHVRVSVEDARALVSGIVARATAEASARGFALLSDPSVIWEQKAIAECAKPYVYAFCGQQRERWQAEADACVAALGIRYYYGDRMPEKETGNGATA